MSDHLLILHHCDPHAEGIPVAGLISALQDLQLLGHCFNLFGQSRYHCGKRFSDWINVYSSHRIVNLDREVPQVIMSSDVFSWCIESHDLPEFIAGSNTKCPNCPKCGHVIENWPDMMDPWFLDVERRGPLQDCPWCAAKWRVYELDWRRRAGFARFTMSLQSVYEGEAEPSCALLQQLRLLSGNPWTWMYLHL